MAQMSNAMPENPEEENNEILQERPLPGFAEFATTDQSTQMEPPPESTLFQNLVPRIDKEELRLCAEQTVDKFVEADKSRDTWREWYSIWLRQLYVKPEFERKDDPFDNASNIVMPLITIATTQFWARAIDALYPSKELVKVLPCSPDKEDALQKAQRVEQHMNFQIQFKMQNFYEGMSKSLMLLPMAGTVIRKTYRDVYNNVNASDFLAPEDFVVDYYTKYLEGCRFMAQVITEPYEAMEQKATDGVYDQDAVDDICEAATQLRDVIKDKVDDVSGIKETAKLKDMEMPRILLECHTYARFKSLGDTAPKPYIITVDKESRYIVRIVDGEHNGKRLEYFTKYDFIPSPDNSFYSIGFGALLFRINEAVNTIINQLIDAGTLANSQAGLINKKTGMKRGEVRMKRGQFFEVDLNTDDIRKAIMPLVFKEPSQVLFQLLGLLQEFTNRVTTVSDVTTGEMPRSDSSATAVATAVEQGLKVFGAIYRGLHFSLGKELKKMFILNQIYTVNDEYFRYIINPDDVAQMGVDPKIGIALLAADDYADEYEIMPVSDPAITTKSERTNKAQAIYQTSLQNPLIMNNPEALFAVTKNFFTALESNKMVINEILQPLAQQIQVQQQMQQQQQQEMQLKERALHMAANGMAQGVVPQELLQAGLQDQQRLQEAQAKAGAGGVGQ